MTAALIAAPAMAQETSPSAVERWQRLKADAEAAAKAPRSTPITVRRAPQDPGTAVPGLPPGEFDLSPSAPVEPDWLVPQRPLTPEEADLSAAPEPPAEPQPHRQVSPAAHISPTIIWPLLSLQDPRRKIRAMSEIAPVYDTAVDKDIRDYADKQAAEYGVKFAEEAYTPRAFPDTVFAWDAADFYHYPLYFEDPALERYGHTYPFVVQPIVSAGRFSAQFLALPYQMTIDPVCKPMYALGYYRPGDCAPKLHDPIPWNLHAAAVEAGVVTGLFFLIP